MNQHLAKAIEIYEKNKLNIKKHILWHMQNGVVLCDNDRFGLYYFTKSNHLDCYCRPEEADTLFVTFYTGDIKKGLQMFIDDFKHVAFSRDFQNSPRKRIYLISDFNKNITK